eukprot:gb/GECG01003106.1/.p1 GENE.gb/GECG01003106.1/~~gb/GECG01003106.1/.p1  ORF type:complete len:601 (+),score=41.72 gb/GECG01003106.1/:1-1803(+)
MSSMDESLLGRSSSTNGEQSTKDYFASLRAFSSEARSYEHQHLRKHSALLLEGRKRTETALDEDVLYPARGEKHVQAFWRWSMLWTLLFALGVPFLPFYLLPLDCRSGQMFVMVIQLYGAAVLGYVAVKCTYVIVKLQQAAQVSSWKSKYPKDDPRTERLKHIVLMRAYKEPLELMFSTITSLQHQTVAKDLIVVIALEEGSPQGYDEAFYKEYAGVFSDLLVTRHPRNWCPMERPGACSNANYAWRQIVSRLASTKSLLRDSMICTSCDTDTVFPPHYFEYIGYAFLTHENPHGVIWQCPLFYNLMLDQRPWFVRCTGLMRTAFMCAFLIGQSLNPMSTFSFSVDLLIRCDFIHPFHVMDDVVHIVTCMKALRGYVPVDLVPIVLISGPTSGNSWCEEIYEWSRQIRRWCIGTMAVYHYFVSKQLRGNFSFWSGIRYHVLFTHYYGFVLCSLLLSTVTAEAAKQIWRRILSSDGLPVCDEHNGYSNTLLQWVGIGSLIFSYIGFGVVFILDAVACRIGGIEEEISWLRNLLHWLLSGPTLLIYNLVQVVSSVEGSLRGQSVISHNAAGKDNLAAKEDSETNGGDQDGGTNFEFSHVRSA